MVLVILLLSSCVGSRIYQRREKVLLKLPEQLSKTSAKEQVSIRSDEPLDLYGTSDTLYVSAQSHDEEMLRLDLSPITITAPQKMLPERDGQVQVDFTLAFPRSILFSTSRLILQPEILLEDGTTHSLEPMDIFGERFLMLQDRSYYLYEKFLDRKGAYTEEDEQRIFERFVRFPFLGGMRLDSLFLSSETMNLSYSQKISTKGLDKSLLRVSLGVEAEAIDGSHAFFPLGDTLQYRISSLMGLMDLRPRYKMVVRDKFLSEKKSYFLNFKQGSGKIDLRDASNLQASEDMVLALQEALEMEDGLGVDSLEIQAWASPEGRYDRNMELSWKRADALYDFLKGRVPEFTSDLLVRGKGEDLQGFIQGARNRILDMPEGLRGILESEVLDADDKEQLIKKRYPGEWKHLLGEVFPELRRVDLVFHYNRLDQVKDTIHLQEEDTEYMEAIELMRSRRYSDALMVLQNYGDLNTAICQLSMSLDEGALRTLDLPSCKNPGSSNWHYLRAVALSRLGRKSEAREALKNAVLIDDTMALRANLDPEIDDL